jgi:DNA-binding GntR family transcriptional regulator
MSDARSADILAFPAAARGLHGTVLDGLRNMINEGALAPGMRVPERRLCETFAISRTPLREALKVLAAEGLVELLPNRGARIATLDTPDIEYLFEVIALLEGEAGRLAAQRISDAALAEIQSMHYRMYAHFLRRELPAYFALNQGIHRAITEASGNPVLVATHAGLAGRIARARFMANRLHPDRWQAAMDEHERILAALCARDGAGLCLLLSQHLRNKRDIVLEASRSPEKAAQNRDST